MGRYQAYPEYKDSGVEWIGQIPSDWKVIPLKRVASLRTGLTPSTENQDNYEFDETEFSWVRPEDLDESGQGVKATKFLSSMGWSLMRHIPASSTLVCCIGTIGKLGYVERVVATNQQITAATFAYAPKFNFYLLQSARKILEQTATGNVIQILNSERLSNIDFLSLPKLDAEKIANFLDQETAKIDTLIEQQQQLIRLLKEKRQAVISHAVTKGLSSLNGGPNAPMKDSGVEWLGEVPAHWVTCSLKHHASVIDCKHITAEFLDDGYPLASIGEVKGWFVNLATAKFTSEKFYFDLIGGGRKPVAGDIIYSRNATVGEAALVPVGLPEFAMGQDVCLIRLDCNLFPEYIMHFLKSPVISRQLELAMVGSTFKRINVDDIRNFNIAMPPLDEQIKIVEHLETLLTKYDQIILGAQQSIDFMQERRIALISAAVTGKIDVRNWQAPQQ